MQDKTYAIVGCGMMGIEHIHNIALLDGARVSCVYDPVPEQAARGAREAGGARIATSFEDLISDTSIDAIVIVSPNHLHLDQLRQIAATRPVPVLCEKPLYIRADQAGEIEALAGALGAPVWVAMEYRYMPPIAALIAQARAVTGTVDMLSIREHRFPFLEKIGNWNRFSEFSGGTLVEKCCHFFDLMRLIIDSEPVRVMASAGQVNNHLDESYNGRVPDIWDCGYIMFDFENGARAMLELCMFADGSRWNEEISAIGQAGKIECRLPGPYRFWPHDTQPMPSPELSISPRKPKNPLTQKIEIAPELMAAGDHHGSTFYQHQRFLEVVRGRASPEVTLHDGARAVAMGLAAQQSAREHRVIELK